MKMNTETMTLREAISQKKLLDKQIDSLFESKFIAVINADTKIVNGLTVQEYKDKAKEDMQSLNDKIKRREAIANAILVANVENFVEVPKFSVLEEIGANEITEKISFASAIARKNYYKGILGVKADRLQRYVDECIRTHAKAVEDTNTRITDIVEHEYANVANASAKQRTERYDELKERFDVVYVDPADLTKKVSVMQNAIFEYMTKIDAKLGHATEITEITIEY